MRATLTKASAVVSKQVTWFVPMMIPEGCITIIDGDPGQGKSFLTLEFAARFTRGEAITSTGRSAQGVQPPRSVVVMNAEDPREHVLVPRLMGLGADMDRVTFLEGPPEESGDTAALFFPQCADLIRVALAETGAKLLIVDPVMAFLDARIKSFSDQDVRRALRPLQRLAQDFECTVLLVRHLNKTRSSKLIYRGGGSIGLIGLARAGIYVGPDPDDRTRKLFAPIKSNFGPLQRGWLFTLEKGADGVQTIAWHGESDRPVSRLLDTTLEKLPREIAVEMLTERCKDGADVPYQDLVADAAKQGVSEGTLKRAYQDLGLRPHKIGRKWYWYDPRTIDPVERIRREVSNKREW